MFLVTKSGELTITHYLCWSTFKAEHMGVYHHLPIVVFPNLNQIDRQNFYLHRII